jgi:hypothetical protein
MTKRATFGRSTFALIRKALALSEKAKTPAARQRHLQIVEGLIIKWQNDHAGSKKATDKQRRAVLDTLLVEVSSEQAQISRAQAQDIYMGNVLKSGKAPSYIPSPPSAVKYVEGTQVAILPDAGTTDPAEKYQLEALTEFSQEGVKDPLGRKGKELVAETGLTQAEIAAIRIFTAEDYKYINPAMVGSTWEGEKKVGGEDKKSWLTENIESKEAGTTFKRGASHKAMREEGGLHAGVAMQGLMKLPEYTGKLYRGAGYTDEDFEKKVVVDAPFPFNSFASGSKEPGVAQSFAYRQAKDGKTCLVIFVLENSGARDVSSLSLTGGEQEATILPGSLFKVKSRTKITPPKLYSDVNATWYEAVLEPSS